jgi:TetR/AcrR family tetracycline transcriptional repressor
MRGLARSLEVDVSALYWHFRDKAELLDAISSSAAADSSLEIPASGSWRERLLVLCGALRRQLEENPELQLMGRRDPAQAPFIVQATGAVARVLVDSGLSPSEVIFVSQTVVHSVTAVVATRSAQFAAPEDETRRYVAALAAELPGDLAEAWLEIARSDPASSFDRYFDQAIGLVLAGIEAAIPQP